MLGSTRGSVCSLGGGFFLVFFFFGLFPLLFLCPFGFAVIRALFHISLGLLLQKGENNIYLLIRVWVDI